MMNSEVIEKASAKLGRAAAEGSGRRSERGALTLPIGRTLGRASGVRDAITR